MTKLNNKVLSRTKSSGRYEEKCRHMYTKAAFRYFLDYFFNCCCCYIFNHDWNSEDYPNIKIAPIFCKPKGPERKKKKPLHIIQRKSKADHFELISMEDIKITIIYITECVDRFNRTIISADGGKKQACKCYFLKSNPLQFQLLF